jgi:SH3-like domain-containing protein
LEETIAELLEQEEQAKDKYSNLIGRMSSNTERQLIERILSQKRFEIETLKLLKTGKTPSRFIGFGMVVDDEVNFREAPSPASLVISELGRGTPVILTERRGNWAGIQLYDGQTGWVFKDYVRSGE